MDNKNDYIKFDAEELPSVWNLIILFLKISLIFSGVAYSFGYILSKI